MKQQTTLQDLVWQNGPLNALLAIGYVNAVAAELERLHRERHICHRDVRPDMIVLNDEGKAILKESTVSQSYSEKGCETDFRDLKAVHYYLLTGKRQMPVEVKSSEGGEGHREDVKERNVVPRSKSIFVVVVMLLVTSLIASLIFHIWKGKKTLPVMELVSCNYGDFHYEGQWVDGKPHGLGTAKYRDGRSYTGRFFDGLRFDEQARFVYADGNVFEGVFAADTIQEGKVTLKSGEYYFVGKFSNGKPFIGYWYRVSDNKKVEKVSNGEEEFL